MDNQDKQVLDAVRRWGAQGHHFILTTVARTWGSAPRPPGAWMALRDDGLVQGSVSGGCIEADLIERTLRGDFADTRPFVVKYGVTQEEASYYGLPCGGMMELVIEPSPDLYLLSLMSEHIVAGNLVRRSVEIGQPGITLAPASPADRFGWDGRVLTTVHGPAWRLLIIGAGQISTYLAQMACALDYQVFVCDPRSEYADAWSVPGTTLVAGMPDDAVITLGLDPHSAVVALTHDPKLDDMVLLDALKSPAFYVGALGSRLNNERRRERLLRHFDLTPEQIARLHGPVGLPIGSHTPPEIAVSILAELTAVKNGVAAKGASQQITDMTRARCTSAEAVP
ncbi:MAG TPA: XdhC family protein [Gammaproteobacteria bacterium]